MSDNGISGGPPAASPRKSSGLNAKVIHVSPRVAEPGTAATAHEASVLEVEELHDEPHGAFLAINHRISLKTMLFFVWIPAVWLHVPLLFFHSHHGGEPCKSCTHQPICHI